MKKSAIPIFLILALGLFIRIYNVGNAPSGMLIDEISHGYNAYSILNTGKDEFGNSYPLSFKAFGDYKLPAYIYSAVIPVKIFGLNSFAVRLPSVIAGTLLILAIYFLLRSLHFNNNVSLMGALITSISPWTIILSRFAWESNLGLLFFTVGLTFLFRSISKNSYINLILSSIFLGMTWYSYIPYRLITILLFSIFLIYFLLKRKLVIKKAIIATIVFLLVISPLIPTSFSRAGTARLNQTNILTKSDTKVEIIESRNYCTENVPKFICYLNSNKATVVSRTILTRYISMLSLNFLFIRGEEARYLSLESFGLLPIFLMPFYICGLIVLIRKDPKNKRPYLKWILPLGILIAGFPSSLSGDPQRVQLSALYPFVVILLAYGILLLESNIKKGITRKLYYSSLVICSLFFTLFFMLNYMSIHLRKFEKTYGNFTKELINYAVKQNNTTQIYIKPFFPHPIMYYAFYSQLHPEIYQKSIVLSQPAPDGFYQATDLNNVHIMNDSPFAISCKFKKNNRSAVIITDEPLLQDSVNPPKSLYTGKTSDGVLTLVYAYGSTSLIDEKTDCSGF